MLILASDPAAIAGITAGATLAAALIVALITAKTTDGRQEREIEAQAKRQEREIAERTAGQKRNLEHVREAVAESGRRLDLLNARMHIRMPKDQPVTARLQDCVDAIHAAWRAVFLLEDAENLAERRNALHKALGLFSESESAFLEAAVTRAGTVPM
jgi:hypothetical protein